MAEKTITVEIRDLVHDATRDFMEKHGIPIRDTPGMPDPGVALRRLCIMMEEVGELHTAINRGEVSDIADAIGDVSYCLEALALSFGMKAGDLTYVVAESNLTKAKLDADSKGGKGGTYVSPKQAIIRLLHEWGWGASAKSTTSY